MTQQPPPQSPQRPEGATQHIAPLWYEQTQSLPQYPAYPPVVPQSPAEPHPAALTQPGAELAQSAKPRRLAELGAVAVLAAVLASAGTYSLTRGDLTASPAASPVVQTSATTSAAPVVQANASAPNWSVTAAAVSPSVVAITVTSGQGGGQGSGVIFDTKGHILTNNHVVAAGGPGSKISVTLNDKRTYDATVVGTDPSTDLAVIKLTNAPKDLKAIALGDANALKVGDPVMAVGNPLGLAGTVTTGIVSALNRPVTTSDQQSTDPFGQQSTADPVVTNAIQTSAAINPGNSGGALVNASGQLVGINSAIASLGSSGGSSSQSGNIGIGFAIPVNEARSIADPADHLRQGHPPLPRGQLQGRRRGRRVRQARRSRSHQCRQRDSRRQGRTAGRRRHHRRRRQLDRRIPLARRPGTRALGGRQGDPQDRA